MKPFNRFLTCVILLSVLVLPAASWAAGFLIYQQDAKAQGMGLNVTASIDNPSAVFYNPSLLPDQKGFSVSAGDIMIFPDRTYKDAATGIKFDAKATTHHIPNFFAKYTNQHGLSLGLGLYSPFGLSSEWPSYWTGRYVSTYAEIRTLFVNPVIAYKFNDNFSLGVGFFYVDSSVEFKRNINLAAFGSIDGYAKLKGDGHGAGANVAATIKLPKDFTLALTFRSSSKIEFDGKSKFYVPAPVRPFFPLPPMLYASTDITLPWIATAGLSKKFGDLTVEADLIYTGWSDLDRYVIDFDPGPLTETNVKKWRNTPSFGIGANYRVNKALEIQAGYLYDKGAVPKSTMSPELPDASRNLFTCGLTYAVDAFKLSAAYQATFFEKADSRRNIVGAPRGTYDAFAHIVLFNVSYTH